MRQTILIAAAVLLLTAAGRATVLVPADVAELTRQARAVARGEVVSVDSQWTEDRRTIETIVTLQIERYLKGRLGETVQFRTPGGRLGRFRNLVVGAPTFEVGQRVVVFLGANGPRIPYLLGLNQGVYRITANPAGAAVVTPALITAVGPVARGVAQRQPAPLADFERAIVTLAGGGQ